MEWRLLLCNTWIADKGWLHLLCLNVYLCHAVVGCTSKCRHVCLSSAWVHEYVCRKALWVDSFQNVCCVTLQSTLAGVCWTWSHQFVRLLTVVGLRCFMLSVLHITTLGLEVFIALCNNVQVVDMSSTLTLSTSMLWLVLSGPFLCDVKSLWLICSFYLWLDYVTVCCCNRP